MLELYSDAGRDLQLQERMFEVVLERILVLTHMAERAMQKEEFETAHVELMRGQAALSILEATVSPVLSGELQQNLKQLYRYMIDQLALANLRKEKEPLEAVRKVLKNLIDAVTMNGGGAS